MKVFVASMVFVVLPIIFVVAIGRFFSKNKSSGQSANLADELEKFKKDHPGKKGNLVYYGFGVLILLVVAIRVFNIYKGY